MGAQLLACCLPRGKTAERRLQIWTSKLVPLLLHMAQYGKKGRVIYVFKPLPFEICFVCSFWMIKSHRYRGHRKTSFFRGAPGYKQ